MQELYFTIAFLPGVGPGEILIIFLAVLLIFGPKKLPEVGKALGECIQQFKKASTSLGSINESEKTKEQE